LTKDYRTAMTTIPDIVTTETHPIKFLRCCQGDPWSAAVRLCHNWTFRRETFGSDHWLKPMRMSHDGALCMEDIEFLRTGAFAIVTAPDDNQRQVMTVNFGRLHGKDHGARKRIAHYLCLTQINAYTQRNGLTVLLVIDGTGMKVKDDNGKLFQVSNTVTIFTIDQVILANDPNETRQTLAHLFGIMMRRLAEKFWGHRGRIVNVIERTTQATLEALVARGLHPSCIPTQLGGNFSYDRDFKEWLAIRICTEQTEAKESAADAATATTPPYLGLGASSTIEALPQAQYPPSPFFIRGCEVSNHQEQNIVDRLPTSSQSAWNFSIPFTRLFGSDPHGDITATNNTGTTMMDLSAASLVDDRTQNTDDSSRKRKREGHRDTDFLRKRNCEYSKKHYYKKKNRIQRLQSERDVLVKEQRKLKDENHRLMLLVQQAQSMVN